MKAVVLDFEATDATEDAQATEIGIMEKTFTITYTLSAILNSHHPLSIEQIREKTGLHQRQLQRHLSVLSARGLVRRIGTSAQQGYRYTSLPSRRG